MTTLEQMEEEMEDLKKAMEDEYETNKESTLYWELYEKFHELEEKYDAAKKEEEEFWDEFNHRRKRCIYCDGLKDEIGNGPCPLSPANIAKKIENLADPVTSTNPPN